MNSSYHAHQKDPRGSAHFTQAVDDIAKMKVQERNQPNKPPMARAESMRMPKDNGDLTNKSN